MEMPGNQKREPPGVEKLENPTSTGVAKLTVAGSQGKGEGDGGSRELGDRAVEIPTPRSSQHHNAIVAGEGF